MSEGEATDPLRERLPRPNAVRLLGHCKSPAERSIYGYIEALEAIACEALAAAPEPEWEYRSTPTFRDLERFVCYHGLARRVGRFVGGPLRWFYKHPERVRIVRGRRLP